MFKKTLLAMVALMLVGSPLAFAQEEPKTEEKTTDTGGPNRFWQATLDGGHYMVALDQITSVSRHRYVLDGAVIVDEVTVDTIGQALARFYFITPVTDATASNPAKMLAERGKELVEQAAERTETDVHNMVMKKYPETSHAKTIEYRILSEGELTSLYDSVRTSWENGRGRKFTTKK